MAVGKRQKSFGRSSPVKSRSGVFPRRPSGPKSGTKTTEVPLFIPDGEDDAILQVADESDEDEWEDFNGESEEDVQMSIAIAESLELQNRSMGISDTQQSAKTPIKETPIKSSIHPYGDGSDRAVGDDEFTSPSRLATQLSIAGARKPLSNRIPSDPTRGNVSLPSTVQPVSPKSKQSPTANTTLGRPPGNRSEDDVGDGGESDDDDDMEEVVVPQGTGNYSSAPAELLEYPHTAPVTSPGETPLAIGVEDEVARGFAEFQRIFAEKRKAFRAKSFDVQEETRQTQEVLRASSPGLEYADEVKAVESQEETRGLTEVRSSPPPRSDEDESMEEVGVVAAPSPVPTRASQPPADLEPIAQPPGPSTSVVAETLSPKHTEDDANGEDKEEAPISDWSRSPSPRPRPPAAEAGPSTSTLTLDRTRGLLDPDESFGQPQGEQEHEDFDAAREMDPDAEAGEFARWISQVKGRDLDDVRKEVEQEINGLRKEQRAAMRDSEDITGQMIAQIMVSTRYFS